MPCSTKLWCNQLVQVFQPQPKTSRYRWYRYLIEFLKQTKMGKLSIERMVSPLAQVFRKPKLFKINRKHCATAGTGLTTRTIIGTSLTCVIKR